MNNPYDHEPPGGFLLGCAILVVIIAFLLGAIL